jgi:AraC-like DNA-binding protein/quercetin dioxygenase-like cupin family protein
MSGMSSLALHAAWTRYVAVSIVHMDAGWSLPTDVHPDGYQMLVLLAGQVEATVEDQHYTAGPGEVLLYSAGMRHAERNAGAGPIRAVFIGFDLIDERPRFPIHSADPSGRIRYLAHWMLEQVPATSDTQRVALHASLLAILAEHSAPGQGHPQDLVGRLREYVRAHLAEPLTLDDLAQTAGLSRFYFSRAFLRAAKQTPMQFVMAMRLDAAQGMLMTSDAPLKQIARATGFSDEFHLSKSFKKALGRSPSSLRRR